MRSFLAYFVAMGFVCALPVSGVFAQHAHDAPPPRPAASPRVAKPLPPLPSGVTHLDWSEFIKTPVGSLGLELTDKIKTLDGKKVRLLGYMVKRDEPVLGVILLSPYSISIEEHEGGFADLPPQTVHVLVPYETKRVVAYSSRPLLLTGTLSVGQQESLDADGGKVVSLFRLTLDMPLVPAPKKAAPKPKPAKAKPISAPKQAR